MTLISTKTCSKCKGLKPLTEFFKDYRNGIEKFRAACKACSKSNPERKAIYDKIRYQSTREKRQVQQKAWKQKNLKEVRRKRRAWYHKNKERYTKYYESNKARIIKRIVDRERERLQTDTLFRVRKR